MKKIFIFEHNGCSPSRAAPLLDFLRRKFGESADIQSFDLAGPPDQLIPLPPSLFLKLDAGSPCLPALVVDSVVVTEGWLPNFLEAVELVESGKPSKRVVMTGCCDPTSCCPPVDNLIPYITTAGVGPRESLADREGRE